MEERRNLQVRLTVEAREALDRFCARYEVSATALLEAISLALGRRALGGLDEIVADARRIDEERRRRE